MIEKHHILPKSMGGTNDEENIVFLTPKEHYVAHHLLWKIHKNREMHFAFWLLATKCSNRKEKGSYNVNSRTYQLLKEQHSKEVSLIHKGKVRSIETRQKASTSLKGKLAWNKGKTGIYSEESIKKMSLARIGFIESAETSKKKSDSAKKRPMPVNIHSEEAKEKRKLSNEQWRISNQSTCPHCDKTGVSFNMKRYHFDNCKFKEK